MTENRKNVEDVKNLFLLKATISRLKEKLKLLNLPTSGSKAVLKLRLEEKLNEMSEEELENMFSHENTSDLQDEDEGQDGDLNCSDEENNIIRENGVGNNNHIVENLDKEIIELSNILSKKKEIEKLKEELLKFESIQNTCALQVMFKELEGSLPNFSGDDHFPIDKWAQIFEENREMYQWNEKISFIYAKKLMAGTAKLFSKTVACSTCSEYKELLRKEFQRKVTSADIHDQLRKRKKGKYETI